MYLARVVGDVVATHRLEQLGGRKLLLVRRLSLDDEVIGVGVGEKVLVVQEGNAARSLFRNDKIPAQAVVVGVIDRVDLDRSEGGA